MRWVLSELELEKMEGYRSSFYPSGVWASVAVPIWPDRGKRTKRTAVLTRIMDKIKERLEGRFGYPRARVENQGTVNHMRKYTVWLIGKRNEFH